MERLHCKEDEVMKEKRAFSLVFKNLYILHSCHLFGSSAHFSRFPISGFKLGGDFDHCTVVTTLVEVLVTSCLGYYSSFFIGLCLFTFF